MKQAGFIAVPLLILAVLLFAGCSPDPEPEDGTVTVTVSTSMNGEVLMAGLFAAGADPNTADPLSAGAVTGNGGTVSLIMEGIDDSGGAPAPDGTTWVGNGGSSYDIYIFFDVNDNYDPTDPGDWICTDYPVTFTLDGNRTISRAYPADFDEVQ